MFTSSAWRHLVFAPALLPPRLGACTMRACAALAGRAARSAAGRSQRGMEGTPGVCGYDFHTARRKCKFLWLGAAGEKQGLDLFWFLATLSSIFYLRLLKWSVRWFPLEANREQLLQADR